MWAPCCCHPTIITNSAASNTKSARSTGLHSSQKFWERSQSFSSPVAGGSWQGPECSHHTSPRQWQSWPLSQTYRQTEAVRVCPALNSCSQLTLQASLRDQKARQTVHTDDPLLQEQRQKGTHSLQVREGTKWLCTSSLYKQESNLSSTPWQDLKETDTTMGHKGTSWEPNMQRTTNRLGCVLLNPEQGYKLETKPCTQAPPQPMDQKGKDSNRRVLGGCWEKPHLEELLITRNKAKYRMLSTT